MSRSVLAMVRRLFAVALIAFMTDPLTPAPAQAEPAASSNSTPAITEPAKKTTIRRNNRRRNYRRYKKNVSQRTAPANANNAKSTGKQTPPDATGAQLPQTEPAPAAVEPVRTAAAPISSGPAMRTEIETVSRQVQIQPGGSSSWAPAKSKMKLSPSDHIKTGSRSTARVKMADGTKVLLLPNSHAELEELSTVERTVKLLKGRVRAIVTKLGSDNRFFIKTPVGVASVRGTDFEVSVDEKGSQMSVAVREGQVGVAKLGDLSNEVFVNPGEKIEFGIEGDLGNPIKTGAVPTEREDVRSEIMDSKAKDAILSMAAEESRNADYQVGKSLIDVDGRRVRVEEYITRPAANQFKLVVLNERTSRFDYFTYKGTFNKDLPDDLSVALKQTGGTLGATAPEYHLTEYETVTSNTIDSVTDSASGGHLVKVTISNDGTKYILDDNGDGTYKREIEIASLQGDGVTYKIYNPARDTFSLVSAANKDEAIKMAVYDSVTDSYRNFTSADTLWKTRFNTYSYAINNVMKTAYSKKVTATNTLAIDLDANFSHAPVVSLAENPSGANSMHQRLTLYYTDGSKTTYDNYIIDDEGKVATADMFSGLSNSAEYRNVLDKLNYQQKISSTEMEGRNIDLVVDPRIGTISGMIQ